MLNVCRGCGFAKLILDSYGLVSLQDSHALRMHQLILRVDGYQQLDPVSVDKVGVYFKYARPRDRHVRLGFRDCL